MKRTCPPRPERSQQVRTDLTVIRYLATGFVAGRDRDLPSFATPMFAVSGAATVIAWTNGSLHAQAKPGPLGLIGGST
jgi:hypothetical protein